MYSSMSYFATFILLFHHAMLVVVVMLYCNKGATEKSVVAEHAWTNQYHILWDGTIVIYQARRQTELFLKEALHIHLTPEDKCFNRDTRTDLPDCWIPTLQAIGMKPHPPCAHPCS